MDLQSLPTEILIKIFQSIQWQEGDLMYVPDVLFNLTKVSKRFNDIISSEKSLMRHFTLELTPKKTKSEWIGSRKYQKLHILKSVTDDQLDDFMEVLQEFGGDIVDIRFDSIFNFLETRKEKTIVKLLMACPNVKTITHFPLLEDENYDGEVPELNLNSLSMYAKSIEFKILRKTQTRKVELSLFSTDGVRDFLMRQEELWSLSIYTIFVSSWTSIDACIAPNFRFPLYYFKVLGEITIFNGENFRGFLRNHSSTLQSISMEGVQDSLKFLDFFAECKNLQRLEIRQKHSWIDSHQNYELTVLDQVTEFYLTFSETLRFDIAELFPNLRKLSVTNHKGASMREIGRIEGLEVLHLDNAVMSHIPKSVRVLSISNVETFQEFAKNSQVEELSVKNCSNLNWLKYFFKCNKTKTVKIELRDVKLRMTESLPLCRHSKKFGNIEVYNVELVSMPPWLKEQVRKFIKFDRWF